MSPEIFCLSKTSAKSHADHHWPIVIASHEGFPFFLSEGFFLFFKTQVCSKEYRMFRQANIEYDIDRWTDKQTETEGQKEWQPDKKCRHDTKKSACFSHWYKNKISILPYLLQYVVHQNISPLPLRSFPILW